MHLVHFNENIKDRVRTGHGKPGKSWNFEKKIPGLESHGISIRVMESHGKLL